MLVVLHALTRKRFAIAFEWGRLARLAAVLVGGTVAGELLLPTSGVVGFVTRAVLALALPVVLVAVGFLGDEEREQAVALVRRVRRSSQRSAST
jgi:hypothetical protein